MLDKMDLYISCYRFEPCQPVELTEGLLWTLLDFSNYCIAVLYV